VVARPETPHAVKGEFAKFFHELNEGLHFIRQRPATLVLGTTWALFLGGMLTQGVITAPLSDRILNAGAEGYGWLNAGWGIGAFLNAFYASKMIAKFGALRTVTISMALLAAGLFLAPLSQVILAGTLVFFLMGSARGLAGISIGSSMMQMAPKHLIGRVQNTFYFAGLILQLVLGWAVGQMAHRVSLTKAFFMIGGVYAVASALTLLPAAKAKPPADVVTEASA
jgi:MFS family permease